MCIRDRGKTGQDDDYHNVDDMVGKRLGVLGYGSIGRQVARVSKAMGKDMSPHHHHRDYKPY